VRTFEFAGYTLDLERSSLRVAGREIELRPKSFEVLRYLVENADRLVTREEAIRAIWPNAVVTDESLTHCVSELRHALDDGQQAIIKTVPRRGYRFAVPVSCLAIDRVREHPSAAVALPRGNLSEGGRSPEQPPLPDRPSIAVLPFQNLSGDAEQEYFADGVVEEIITALSRFSGLFVIARNSSFTYKGQAVDLKQVGRELGVRYVLEGSVRKASHRVRITGQLIDTTNGAHLWADRFDGSLEDIIDLQDDLTANVVNAMAPKLEQAEIARAKRKSTESLDAYDYFLRGMESAYLDTRETVDEALRLFSRAIELDAQFAAAYGMAAYCYVLRKASGWMTDRVREVAEATRLARKAVQLGKEDAVSLSRGGHTLAYVAHELDAGAIFIDRAITLNPNLASSWLSSGWLRVWIGEPDLAIKHFAHFKRMSPLDPLMPVAQSGSAFAHFHARRYEEAALLAQQVLQESPNLHQALRVSVASNALAGRIQQAHAALARLRRIDPALRVSNLGDVSSPRRPEDMAQYLEAMRKAGLPE
jgi:TolB-like protein/DNA-binding winged helix-turn-helix (wHTH) protein/Tfp pilus assembly protein PilF